jgi:rubrerythrin
MTKPTKPTKPARQEDPSTKPTDIGPNRTGIATSPVQAKAAVQGAADACREPAPDGEELSKARADHARGAPPVGTMPPPASMRGAATAVVKAIKGNSALAFLDLLGERLAFERTGTRLYDALIVKLEGADPRPTGPTREQLEDIRDDEMRHFGLLRDAIQELGGDPTVITPSADVVGVAGSGWVQALTEPRTTLTEALKVVLAAELADADGWDTLVEVATGLGQEQLAAQFSDAAVQEESHLMRVRAWVMLAVAGQVGIEPPQMAVTDGGSPGVPAP